MIVERMDVQAIWWQSLAALQSLLFRCSVIVWAGTRRNAESDRSNFAICWTHFSLILRCLAILRVFLLVPDASSCELIKSATCSILSVVLADRCLPLPGFRSVAEPRWSTRRHMFFYRLQVQPFIRKFFKRFFCILYQVRTEYEFLSCHLRISYTSLTASKLCSQK